MSKLDRINATEKPPLRDYLQGRPCLVACVNRCRKRPRPWHCHIYLRTCPNCGGPVEFVSQAK